MGTENLSPEEKSLIGKLGAETLWSKTVDRTALTQPARDAVFQRFRDQVDPNRILPADVRERLAHHAQRAHMHRLAHNRLKANRQRADRDSERRSDTG
jgi:hypothetical protein